MFFSFLVESNLPKINLYEVPVTVTGSDTEVSDNTMSLFDRLRIYELSMETGGELNHFGGFRG